MDAIHMQRNLKKNDFWKCGLCQNHCMVAASCKPTEIVTLDRCFWKELTIGVTTYKNKEIIECNSVTIMVGPHQIRHMVSGDTLTIKLEKNQYS
jgi:hypothetical protein